MKGKTNMEKTNNVFKVIGNRVFIDGQEIFSVSRFDFERIGPEMIKISIDFCICDANIVIGGDGVDIHAK